MKRAILVALLVVACVTPVRAHGPVDAAVEVSQVRTVEASWQGSAFSAVEETVMMVAPDELRPIVVAYRIDARARIYRCAFSACRLAEYSVSSTDPTAFRFVRDPVSGYGWLEGVMFDDASGSPCTVRVSWVGIDPEFASNGAVSASERSGQNELVGDSHAGAIAALEACEVTYLGADAVNGRTAVRYREGANAGVAL